MNDKRATMREVAKLAGVSPMTVSNALSNKPGVAAETRRLVLEAAKKLHYTPNMLAKSFRTDRTNTIGVITSSNFEEVFSRLFHGIESSAAEAGYSCILANTQHNIKKEREVIELLVGKRVDGLIITSPLFFGNREMRLLEGMGIPYVTTMRTHKNPNVSTVQNNNHKGGFEMVDYLIRTGSKRFLFIALDDRFSSSAERVQGWREALEAHNLSVDKMPLVHCEPIIEMGAEIMRQHLSKKRSWDTVVCGCDTIAVGAMDALIRAGVAIPEQVRITGYDDIPMAGYLRVPLTTVHQPLQSIGQASVRILAEMIKDRSAGAQQVTINGKLIIRDSA